jgi:purine catabolism regulator
LTAVSGPAIGARDLPEAARQARFVAGLLATGALRGPVAQFDAPRDLHVYRLLYDLWGTPAADRFVDETLGPLRRGDRRGELQKTLAALLDAGGSHAEAARRLGIHRNTLAYRVRQIEDALGRDLRDADVRIGLHLALLLDGLPPADDSRRRQSDRAAADISLHGAFDGR